MVAGRGRGCCWRLASGAQGRQRVPHDAQSGPHHEDFLAERHLRQGQGGPATHLAWSVPGARAGIPAPGQVPEACLTVFPRVDLRVIEPACPGGVGEMTFHSLQPRAQPWPWWEISSPACVPEGGPYLTAVQMLTIVRVKP